MRPGQLLPGLLIAFAIAATARVVAAPLPAWVPEVSVAVLAGILVAAVVGDRSAALGPGLSFATRRVLRAGIVLLGARLGLDEVVRIGAPGLLVVIGAVTIGLLVAVTLGRLARIEPRLAVLLAVGTAICGNSAIIATAPIVAARSREIAYAVATITLFGTIAVFAYPAVGRLLGLEDGAVGLWTGVAVQDTSQVVAAAAAHSPGALDVATVIKLIRNTLMAPLLIGISWAWARSEWGREAGSGSGTDRAAAVRSAVPLFVLGFLAMAGLRTVGLIGPELAALLDDVARACILVAVAAVGASIRFREMRAVGPRPIMVGFGASLLLGAVSLVVIVVAGGVLLPAG